LSIQSMEDGLSMIAHLNGILKTGRQVGCRRRGITTAQSQ
jgi:hypothetical protein